MVDYNIFFVCIEDFEMVYVKFNVFFDVEVVVEVEVWVYF